jgi:predicted nucleic acid-binding protein
VSLNSPIYFTRENDRHGAAARPEGVEHGRPRSLIIAATAISLDYTVATVNIRDFEEIPGLNMEQLKS